MLIPTSYIEHLGSLTYNFLSLKVKITLICTCGDEKLQKKKLSTLIRHFLAQIYPFFYLFLYNWPFRSLSNKYKYNCLKIIFQANIYGKFTIHTSVKSLVQINHSKRVKIRGKSTETRKITPSAMVRMSLPQDARSTRSMLVAVPVCLLVTMCTAVCCLGCVRTLHVVGGKKQISIVKLFVIHFWLGNNYGREKEGGSRDLTK